MSEKSKDREFWPRNWQILESGHVGEKPTGAILMVKDPFGHTVRINLSLKYARAIGEGLLKTAQTSIVADPIGFPETPLKKIIDDQVTGNKVWAAKVLQKVYALLALKDVCMNYDHEIRMKGDSVTMRRLSGPVIIVCAEHEVVVPITKYEAVSKCAQCAEEDKAAVIAEKIVEEMPSNGTWTCFAAQVVHVTDGEVTFVYGYSEEF